MIIYTNNLYFIIVNYIYIVVIGPHTHIMSI